jgi:hypothetical protein
MSNFVIVPDKWNYRHNFWDYNFQLSSIGTFKELYEEDQSENKELSSQKAWIVWLLSDPSPKNRIWRLENDMKRESISYWYPDINIDDPLIQECIANYDLYAMTPAARVFKALEAKLIERGEMIKNTPYTMDEHIGFDKTGRAQIKPGTAKDLETMAKNTLVIFKSYEDAKRSFLDEFENNGRVWGGREETFRERGELPTKEELGIK